MTNPFIVLINNSYSIKIIKIENLLKNNVIVFNHKHFNIIADDISFEVNKQSNCYIFKSSNSSFFNSERIKKNKDVLLRHGSVVMFMINGRFLLTCVFMEKLNFSNTFYVLNDEVKNCLDKKKEKILYNGKNIDYSNVKAHDILVLDENLFFCTKNHILTLSPSLKIGNERITLNNDEFCQDKLVLENAGLKDRLENVSFTIKPGELVAIIGTSGTGKTTLINMISGNLKHNTGRIYLSKTGKIKKKDFGMVFQTEHFLENLTIKEILLKYANVYCNSNHINEIVDELGLSVLQNRKFANLSGGEKKRVAIAVGLLNDPKILFLDEPDSSLSPELITNLLNILKRICTKRNTMILVITHHSTYINEYFDKVIVLSKNKKINGKGNYIGNLAFFGTPSKCLEHFKIQSITDVYNLL